MNRRLAWELCLLCVCLTLTGCVSGGVTPTAAVTLPPAVNARQAPENDAEQSYERDVLLYVPSLDGTQLLAVPQTALLSAARPAAQALCELLLAYPGGEDTTPVGGDVALSLSGTDAVEVSGQVATVSLSASALRLTHEQMFTVGQALANTLCQTDDVQYVNVLVAGTQPGLNVAATLPAGSFQPNTWEELATLWARASGPSVSGRRSFAATLYFPAPSGKGILCEGRTLAFADPDLPGMAATLLGALSSGAEQVPNVPRCPDLKGLLQSDITLEESGGSRRIALHFQEWLNSALIEAGITRSVMTASLVYTLTTFLPGIDGVEITVGEEKITSLTPSGTYLGAGETVSFPDGVMRRRDFVSFLLAECALYFADAQGNLTRVYRPVPFYQAYSARALLEQMMLGPQPFDSRTGLFSPLPRDLRSADLLGVALDGHTLLLNFSARLPGLCAGLSPEEERRMVYALVDTVCQLPAVKKAALFVQGGQPDTLAGALYLPGDFLPDPEM